MSAPMSPLWGVFGADDKTLDDFQARLVRDLGDPEKWFPWFKAGYGPKVHAMVCRATREEKMRSRIYKDVVSYTEFEPVRSVDGKWHWITNKNHWSRDL